MPINENIISNKSNFISEAINNTINITSELNFESNDTLVIKQIHDILIVVLLVLVMFAMGCSVKLNQVLNHIIRPTPLLVALICQFGIFPLISYVLIRLISITPLNATGLLILASSPDQHLYQLFHILFYIFNLGGVLSNIFTYFWSGDISLSITMTTVATIIALIAMPFNIWLYGRNLGTESLIIPYKQMSFTLIFITIPVFFGMIINWKSPQYSTFITKVGAMAGFAVIVCCQTLEIFIFPNIFKDIPLVLYIVDGVLPFIGLAIGYLFSSLLCLEYRLRKTIAVEIGIKNIGTAITIITLSFPFELLSETILFPFLYTFSSMAVLIITTIFIRINEKICYKSIETLNCDERRLSTNKSLIKRDNVNRIIIENRYELTNM